MGQGPVFEKCPVLLCKDSRYAIEQLFSIIKHDNYEDLGNHATEAMGETGLFSLAQVCIRPSLFPISLSPLFLTFILIFVGGAHDEGPDGPCMAQEKLVDCLKERANATEES